MLGKFRSHEAVQSRAQCSAGEFMQYMCMLCTSIVVCFSVRGWSIFVSVCFIPLVAETKFQSFYFQHLWTSNIVITLPP